LISRMMDSGGIDFLVLMIISLLGFFIRKP
jgi:hypothetical protein